MNRIERCKTWLRGHEDLLFDLVRIYLGTGLFVKALYLMSHRDYLMQVITNSQNDWFAPAMVAHYVISAHLVGGILLALGLITRVAAWFQVPILLGAVFWLYLPQMATIEPRQNLEFSGLVCFLLILFGIFGAGRFSMDYMISRKRGAAPSESIAAPQPH
jgi:uncharacterized membrane protein YphA (DoxX/SURF4 family)